MDGWMDAWISGVVLIRCIDRWIGLFSTFSVDARWGPPLFFQAEDGIRDCLLSRGLGDVYKRQTLIRATEDELDGWMDGWMDGWIDGWVDGWMDE